MESFIINKSSVSDIYLEYDKKSYKIDYVEHKNQLVLRRLSDDKILEIFSDNIGFIIQYNTDHQTNFLVTDYSKKENGEEKIKFKHYIAESSLRLKNEFDCDSAGIDCRVTNNSFLIEQNGTSACLYNLDEKSKRFTRIYVDEKIKEIFGDDTLMVKEKVKAFLNSEIEDTITYGINPKTYEIVTPIWSELQQRYIDVYTKEQVNLLNEQNNWNINLNHTKLGDVTIQLEVERYLNILNQYLNHPQSVYLDDLEMQINEEFVKKFIRR